MQTHGSTNDIQLVPNLRNKTTVGDDDLIATLGRTKEKGKGFSADGIGLQGIGQ